MISFIRLKVFVVIMLEGYGYSSGRPIPYLESAITADMEILMLFELSIDVVSMPSELIRGCKHGFGFY